MKKKDNLLKLVIPSKDSLLKIMIESELSETQNYAYWYARFLPGTHVFH